MHKTMLPNLRQGGGAENPNAVSPAKAGVNLGVGVYGLYGGPPGWIFGTIYFVTEAAYPGGVKGVYNDQSKTLSNLNDLCNCDASVGATY